MNEMIERYIYDVTRRLPEKERAEVSLELEASIIDMLPNAPTDADIEAVIRKLGSPAELAEQYRQNPRYLISPANFELYLSVLKTVALVIAAIFACVGAISLFVTGLGNVGAGDVFGSIMGNAINGVFQAAFWVTIGFAIYERVDTKRPEWSIDKLPRLPDQSGVKISRSSTITEIALSVFFTSLFILAITRNEGFFIFINEYVSDTQIIHPFSQDALTRFIPVLLVSFAAGMVLDIMKLLYARWNLTLCITNIFYNIIWVSLAFYVLSWPDLFSTEFLNFAQTFSNEWDLLTHIGRGISMMPIGIIFAIIGTISVISSIYNTVKGMRKTL